MKRLNSETGRFEWVELVPKPLLDAAEARLAKQEEGIAAMKHNPLPGLTANEEEIRAENERLVLALWKAEARLARLTRLAQRVASNFIWPCLACDGEDRHDGDCEIDALASELDQEQMT